MILKKILFIILHKFVHEIFIVNNKREREKEREREGREKERALKSNSAYYFCHVMKKKGERSMNKVILFTLYEAFRPLLFVDLHLFHPVCLVLSLAIQFLLVCHPILPQNLNQGTVGDESLALFEFRCALLSR